MNGAVTCVGPYDEVPPRTHVNFMAQRRPRHRVSGFPMLSQLLTDQEPRRGVEAACGHGLDGEDRVVIPQRARAILQ